MDIENIDKLFDQLFPICRSITGDGLLASLKILSNHIPLDITSVPSGTKVFDWTVPKEWQIFSGTLVGPDQKTYADFSQNNLSIVNYSTPINTVLPLDELQNHLYSMPELPNAIPYVTSYYSDNWGFCLPHNIRSHLPPGLYTAKIESNKIDGNLYFGETILPGESDQEVLISSYLCHPSMANNELSGPLVLVQLYNQIKKWKKRRYTYRFYIGPETIGSITYLSLRGEHLKKNLKYGLVLTCLGGPATNLSLKLARDDQSFLNLLANYLNEQQLQDIRIRPFTPISGSDERQFCSPGFNLPIAQVARTVYGDYLAYHTSEDDKKFMTIEALIDSSNQIEKFLSYAEIAGIFYNSSPYGEVQLGRRGLYPNINSHETRTLSSDSYLDGRQQLNCILHILNYSDGKHSMMDIAKICGVKLDLLKSIIVQLEDINLISITGTIL